MVAQAIQKTRARSVSPFGVFLIGLLLLSSLSVLWSLATPISGAPDEPAHIIKAASVVRGEFVGPPGPVGNYVQVPRYIAYTNAQTCYVAILQQPADCALAAKGDQWTTVRGTTSAGLYNPVYYILVGWPSLIFHDSTGIYAIRIVSGVISSLFLALGLTMISTWKRRLLPIAGLFIATTPMIFFLNGSVNPNSIEISATLAAFIGMLSIVTDHDPWRTRSRLVIISVASSIAVNMRGLSPIWVAAALAIPLLLGARSELIALFTRKSTWIAIGIIGVFTTFAIGWLTASDSLSAPESVQHSGDKGPYPLIGAPPIFGFVAMFVHTIDNFNGMFGQFGWLDTPAPTWVYAAWYVLFGLVAIAGVITLSGRRLVFVLSLAALLFLVPALVQAAYITSGGWIWQGRYSLPAFVSFVVGCATVLALATRPLAEFVERRLMGIILTVWSLAQITCFIVVLRRYAVGSTGSWVSLFAGPRWQPPLGTVLLTVLFVVVVSSAVIVSLIWTNGRRGVPRTTGAQPDRQSAPREEREVFAVQDRPEPVHTQRSQLPL